MIVRLKMRGRPRKYKTDEQRRAAARTRKSAKRVAGRYWRVIIPSLIEYGVYPKRSDARLHRLKERVVDLLQSREHLRGLDGWCVAWQTHRGSGYAHLDILLTYSKRVLNPPTRYDYLLKHGDVTKYRNLNRAILSYGFKQDRHPLTNIDTRQVLAEARVRSDLYGMMHEAMLEDPFNFNCHEWIHRQRLSTSAVKTTVFKNIRMLKQQQRVVCHELLSLKPGIPTITRMHIQARLTGDELALYDSWQGYQTIVDHINHIPKWGFKRPHKSPNLFVTGRPNTGKTTLGRRLSESCPSYPLGTRGGWFPSYASGVYTLLRWDEFNLSTLPYSDMLKLLQGEAMKLPQKGGHVERADNQLVYMTSNLTLDNIICARFKTETYRTVSRANLKPRITEVQIPAHLDLFVLLKLFEAESHPA